MPCCAGPQGQKPASGPAPPPPPNPIAGLCTPSKTLCAKIRSHLFVPSATPYELLARSHPQGPATMSTAKNAPVRATRVVLDVFYQLKNGKGLTGRAESGELWLAVGAGGARVTIAPTWRHAGRFLLPGGRFAARATDCKTQGLSSFRGQDRGVGALHTRVGGASLEKSDGTQSARTSASFAPGSPEAPPHCHSMCEASF
jgi:hypothetical protein